jgi:hypothetical protein
LGIFTTLLGFASSVQGTTLLNQDFSSSTIVSNYVNLSAPNSGQFNSIMAGANAGTWSINGGGLQIVRTGSWAADNKANVTRSTDFSGPPTVMTLSFDLGINLNSWQSNSMSFAVGKIDAPQDYDINANTFFYFQINGASNNLFKFEAGGTLSTTFPANGTVHHVTIFLNKSGTSKIYQGLDNTSKTLSNNSVALWVGTTCLYDNIAAGNGAQSTLNDFHFLWGAGENGTYKLDNINVVDTLPSTPPPTNGKITLTSAMVLNESAVGDAAPLVDEQVLSGDPVNTPPGGSPVTQFHPGWGDPGNWVYPVSFIIDLGTNYQLSNITHYDSTGTGNLTFATGTPFNWTTLLVDGQTGYNTWQKHPVNVTTRYVRVTIASSGAVPNEILLYGTQQGTPAAPPTPVTTVPPMFDKFMGVDTFIGEPLHRQEAFGVLREYRDWSWFEGHNGTTYPGYPNNQNGFNPAWTGDNWDNFYQNLKTAGLIVSPAIQNSTMWMTGNNASLMQNKPILAGSGRDPLLPASYIEHADHMFQSVARYGNQVVTDSLLKLRADNPRTTGANLINYYENWNEHDKWWAGRDAYFTPYEYAAMSSADYDGHQGTMGATKGVKNADSTAKMVMSGLANPTVDYIKVMKLWSDYKRGGSFPADVINVHKYSNNGTGQFASTIGISPEADNLKDKMAVIRLYRDTYLPGKEFWVSEFGYDTNSSSTQGAPAIGTFNAQEVQGQWLVRSYFALAAAGVDRAMAFTLVDPSTAANTGTYATSGLIDVNGAVKTSWWYAYTLKNRLANLRFDAEQASGNANVLTYRFKDAGGVVRAYAVWCPTSNQTTVNNYVLTLSGSHTAAHQIALTSGNIGGTKTALTISSGTVTVNVSERPILVLLDNTNTTDPVMSSKITLTPAMVTNESGQGTPTQLVDEQTLSADPREKNGGGSPVTQWSTSSANASAYIDLGAVKQIDRIYLYDSNNVGNLTISVGTPGSWTPLFVDDMTAYNSWREHVVTTSTRYIRVTRNATSANVNEIVIYGK